VPTATILNIPPLYFGAYDPGELPPGTYNLGIVCRQEDPGPDGGSVFRPFGEVQTRDFWNTQVTFIDGGAGRPGMTWFVGTPSDAGVPVPGPGSGIFSRIPGANHAGAEINNGNGSAPQYSGSLADIVSIRLPAQAGCDGDSQDDNFRWRGYWVAANFDLVKMAFGCTGPIPYHYGEPWETFRVPLYGAPPNYRTLTSQLTAVKTMPGGPGLIFNIPPITFGVFSSNPNATEVIPVGVYNVGIACTQGSASPVQLRDFWNVPVYFGASDAGVIADFWEVLLPDGGGCETVAYRDSSSTAERGLTRVVPTREGLTRERLTREGLTRAVARRVVARPRVARPRVARPRVAQLQVARPQVARPRVAQLQVARPRVAQPRVAQPPVARPQEARRLGAPQGAAPPAMAPPAAGVPPRAWTQRPSRGSSRFRGSGDGGEHHAQLRVADAE
jgi:hypothetical protein